MAENKGPTDSTRANQYLNPSDILPEVKRPSIDVPIDIGYSVQRFLNPSSHAEDRDLRPSSPEHRTPLTEEQSRERMAAILAAAAMPPSIPNNAN
ncbi:hypothetical protein F4778DRAFT_258111 [Xylariomycetidae sp. FL2044]|nr:hypothetical protein F4778DRAFT_258111 [Xylariomycetidae sp. FL2044]